MRETSEIVPTRRDSIWRDPNPGLPISPFLAAVVVSVGTVVAVLIFLAFWK